MHLHFEKNNNAKCDCNIFSLSWMGKVPDELPEDGGWKLNRSNYYQEGWLATGNARGLVGVTFTTSHCRTRASELPLRSNYNLRGHRSEVILVKWNEPYQKLASCDSSGVIFVWIKYEGKWSIELINDRSTPVTHFSWSHDGRMALICYRDGFVLVGSVAGQRYWSSMLNDKAIITCGIWTPDDQQVYFGTTAGQLIVMDVHGAMVSEVQLSAGVTSMAWSAEKFKMEEGDDEVTDERSYVLAVCLADGNIVMLRSFDDVSPINIKTNLKAPLHAEWSNSRKLLATAGIKVPDLFFQNYSQEYTNLLKFYSDSGTLIYTTPIPYTQSPVSALTWGHNDRRLFVATGTRVHAAWVSRRVGSLQLLSRLAVRQALTKESSVQQLPLPPRLRALVAALFANTIRCCVPEPRDLRRFVSRPPPGSGRLHCTMLRHAGEPAPCYTLYLEYLGGLVPLLKGRRTSKIRPEFVIFDPQNTDTLNVPDYTSQYPSFSDCSDNEKSTAELCGSPRMNKRKSRRRRDDKYNEENDDLAYVDTLPENAKLVEVTSNIWGTKFKIHGVADCIPANLGEVTYRTSLLHMQPRQMSLVITELRDDLPAGPDPSFNPNLFSEDEEETFQEAQCSTDSESPPIAPMSPRAIQVTTNRPKSQVSQFRFDGENLVAALARAESYEDEFYPVTNATIEYNANSRREMEFSFVNRDDHHNYLSDIRINGRLPTRHNGARCCDVPALQSPKNAVAPTQTLIATNSNNDYNNIQRMKSVLSDQSNSKKEFENNKLNTTPTTTDEKTNLSNSIIATCIQNGRNQNSGYHTFNNNPAYLNKPDYSSYNYCSSLCHRINSKNNLNSGSSSDGCGPYLKSSVSNIPRSPKCSYRLNDSASECHCPKLLKSDDLEFIDEEEKDQESGPSLIRKTPTVMSISPLCSTAADSIVRSCSVGYLDTVDTQMVPCDVALRMLRKDAPNKRLVLVSRKTKRKKKLLKERSDIEQSVQSVKPKLNNCGKSKSLDSSDIFPSMERIVVEQVSQKKNVEVKVEEKKVVEKKVIVASKATFPVASVRESSPSVSVNSSLDGLVARLRDFEDSHSLPPPSPRPTSRRPFLRLPRSSPSSPAPSKKEKRPASASPIRRKLLLSPLLNRKSRKNKTESSDDEGLLQEEPSSSSYRNLETFQKAQVRQKLKNRSLNQKTDSVRRREILMHNKAPMWNDTSQVYQLDFGGRVTQESAKNFQIEFNGKQVMQFGRIDGNAYTLDFQYPFSAIQAFAVALANVTQRLK